MTSVEEVHVDPLSVVDSKLQLESRASIFVELEHDTVVSSAVVPEVSNCQLVPESVDV